MPISGTKEWAEHSVNCCSGCSHDCRYCYARAMAIRCGRATEETWKVEQVRKKQVAKKWNLMPGRVVFPTTHDITPGNLDACLEVLGRLLKAGNTVLVVSKPHLECMRRVYNLCKLHRERVMFRFSIGGITPGLLEFWEPHAPSFDERTECLWAACQRGFNTSVSAEPLLEYDRVDHLVRCLEPYVTDAIWIGKLNKISSRVRVTDDRGAREVAKIKANQTDLKILDLYERHKANPKIRWKESIKSVVGLELAHAAGLDR